MFEIRLLTPSDSTNYAEHLVRHICESGVGDNPIYTAIINPPTIEEIQKSMNKKWSLDLQSSGWSRSWGVFFKERIIGHLDINGGHIPALSHRVDLSMGLEEAFRKQKLGTQLMDIAIDWIRQHEFIEFIDLGVFTHNQVALRLYKKYGFQEIGRIHDRFRLLGKVIDDIIMELPLK